MLDSSQSMERFLASVERRAFRMAQIATNSTDDALDIVQEAMLPTTRSISSRKPCSAWLSDMEQNQRRNGSHCFTVY
jgi:RNA polymerase sigma-70 factor (ECF subfamily)